MASITQLAQILKEEQLMKKDETNVFIDQRNQEKSELQSKPQFNQPQKSEPQKPIYKLTLEKINFGHCWWGDGNNSVTAEKKQVGFGFYQLL
jgi:hypothetical protein